MSCPSPSLEWQRSSRGKLASKVPQPRKLTLTDDPSGSATFPALPGMHRVQADVELRVRKAGPHHMTPPTAALTARRRDHASARSGWCAGVPHSTTMDVATTGSGIERGPFVLAQCLPKTATCVNTAAMRRSRLGRGGGLRSRGTNETPSAPPARLSGGRSRGRQPQDCGRTGR